MEELAKIAPSGTTFTPCGEDEPSKTCSGPCGRFLPSVKFGFKYETRNGVRGKARNSSCLDCRKGSSKIKEQTFKGNVESRLILLEDKVSKLTQSLEEERSKTERLQLVVLNLSGNVEELKLANNNLKTLLDVFKPTGQK